MTPPKLRLFGPAPRPALGQFPANLTLAHRLKYGVALVHALAPGLDAEDRLIPVPAQPNAPQDGCSNNKRDHAVPFFGVQVVLREPSPLNSLGEARPWLPYRPHQRIL